MTWMGPTYGMWADTVDEINEAVDQANRANKSLEQWKSYAKKLEGSLKDVAGKYGKMTEMYIGKAGAEHAQALLKEEALKEIAKLDPSNKLLDPGYRKAIYDKEKETVEKSLREQ